MGLYPPDDPYLYHNALFGLPIAIRWYGLLIVGGALLGTWLAARRAQRRGYDPDHVWNLLMLGMLLGVAGARIYYVLFEWGQFRGDLLKMVNITTGGLAIHGAVIGAVLAALFYTRRHGLRFLEWGDLFVPGFLLAQAIGRWGNFFNQEAYGVPAGRLTFGVLIDAPYRLPPYHDLAQYPLDTLFHATFLYESVWNLCGVLLLLLLDYRHGTQAAPPRRWLRHGDLLLLYLVYYSLGRFWIEGLRTDSLYLGSLRIAQVVSLLLVAIGAVLLFVNHRRSSGGEAAPAP